MSKERSGVHSGVLQEIIGKGKRGAKILPAGSGSVLRERRASFQDQVRFWDEVLEGLQGSAISGHTFMVRLDRAESNPSDF
jgi:hypothetical protein